MPPIFKALISITVWILFIKGCIGVVLAFSIGISAMLAGETVPIELSASCAVGSFAFILACVAAWLWLASHPS